MASMSSTVVAAPYRPRAGGAMPASAGQAVANVAARAAIARNRHQEVYFASYSGGAHCCTHVVIAEELGKKWVAVTVGDFDGDGKTVRGEFFTDSAKAAKLLA